MMNPHTVGYYQTKTTLLSLMAAKPRISTELLIPSKWHDTDTDTTPATNIPKHRMSTETKSICAQAKVPVIYYLSRNGLLEHPHFIEVPVSSSHGGLYLRDVIHRLNILRGNGMTSMYSWSSKRSYKNGYLWQDLSDADLIQPTNVNEYVLKGSELVQTSQKDLPEETGATSLAAPVRRKNQSWTSFDNPHEYKVYKCESSRELTGKSADAGTQTDEERRRLGLKRIEHEKYRVELSRGDLSPPPSNSSSEALDGSRDVDQSAEVRDRTVIDQYPSGRMKASLVLKQLISCGSFDQKHNLGLGEGAEYGKRM